MILSMLQRIAYEADFFKMVFRFTFSKGRQFSTKMGTCLTLATLAILIYFLIQSDMIQKKNPSVISQIFPKISPPQIALNKGNINISFLITDQNFMSERIDPQIFDFQINGLEYNTSNSRVPKMTTFTDSTCTSNEINNINLATCLDMQDFQLEGGIFDVYSSEIMIELNICNNITSNITCKTVEEIEAYLQGKFFGIYYSDYYPDVQNYENPIKTFPRLEQISLSPLSQYIGQLYLRKGEMIQDDGVIYSSITQFDYFTRDELTINLAARASFDDPAPLVQFWFFSAQKLEQVNRTYQSLQDLLAKLSGIANLLIIVGFLFMNIYNKIFTSIYLVNKLFISHLKEKIKTVSKTVSQKTEMICISPISPISLEKVTDKKINDPSVDRHIKFTYIQPKKIDESEKDLNDIQEEIIAENEKNLNSNEPIVTNSPRSTQKGEKIGKNLKRELEKEEKFTFYDYISAKIKHLFRVKLSFRQKLYLEAEKELQKIMNIKYILRQIHEFAFLKNILLNPMQNMIFDSIPKPVNLSKKFEEKARNTSEKKKPSEKKLTAIKITNFLNSYEEEGRKSEIDDRLFQYLKWTQ